MGAQQAPLKGCPGTLIITEAETRGLNRSSQCHSSAIGAKISVLTKVWASLSRDFSLGGRAKPVRERPLDTKSNPERKIFTLKK